MFFRLPAHPSWHWVICCRSPICFGHGVTGKWPVQIRGKQLGSSGRRRLRRRRTISKRSRSSPKSRINTIRSRRKRKWRRRMSEATATHVEPQFEEAEQQREAATMGMWLFLATEVLFFGGMFLGYTVYRISYPEAFAEASRHTLIVFGAVNTAVLFISSTAMAFAVRAARANRRGLSGFLLLLTAFLGALFLVIKGFEYAREISAHFVPGGNFHIEAADSKHVEWFF